MIALRETAYAKLNLALHVRGVLPDGRHRIETIFVFCEDGDELTFERPAHTSCEVEATGPFGSELGDDNLAKAAWWKMCHAAHIRGGARFSIDKRLPIASGLGGGSADAAAALRLLTAAYKLDARFAKQVAPQIGADVPACLVSRPSRGTGAGDRLVPIDLPALSKSPALLVNPLVRLSTGDVFARWDGVDRGPLGDWRAGRNDLEGPAISLVPQIAEILDWLRRRPGADFVRMSGSGATCFALFDSDESCDAAAAAVPARWWHLATQLR